MAAPTHKPWEILPTREEQLTEKWFMIGWTAGVITTGIICILAVHFTR